MHLARGDNHHRTRRGNAALSAYPGALCTAGKGSDHKLIMKMGWVAVLIAGGLQDLHAAVQLTVAPQADLIAFLLPHVRASPNLSKFHC